MTSEPGSGASASNSSFTGPVNCASGSTEIPECLAATTASTYTLARSSAASTYRTIPNLATLARPHPCWNRLCRLNCEAQGWPVDVGGPRTAGGGTLARGARECARRLTVLLAVHTDGRVAGTGTGTGPGPGRSRATLGSLCSERAWWSSTQEHRNDSHRSVVATLPFSWPASCGFASTKGPAVSAASSRWVPVRPGSRLAP